MSLARLAALHGVSTSYEPTPGRTVQVPESAVVGVLAALGVDASSPSAVQAAIEAHAAAERRRLLPPTLVSPAGAPLDPAVLPVGAADELTLELTAESGGPLDPGEALPPGCHTLHAGAEDGRTGTATLIAAPARAPEPPARSTGLVLQLPSLLSTRSWGMGDLGDLAELAAWSARTHGMDFVQLGPLHAAVPGHGDEPADPSPYRPSSRRFADPVHLRIEDVPEYRYLPPEDRERAFGLLEQAVALRESVGAKGGLIDRDAVWRLKRAALELIRRVELTPGRRVAYHDFLAGQGQALDDYAAWCALAEIHGPDWRSWPGGLADPRSTAAIRARHELLDRIDFHSWLAWLTDSQLWRAQRIAKDAGMTIGVVHDLALGVHPSGADAWAEQDALAPGCSVGAPPDAFNLHGQEWGVPPWRPDALADAGYAPYREVLRAVLRRAGALRIDHVMGLFRQWWVPAGRPPSEGTYVAYDASAMLAVLALEAHRAGTPVIGEDLGTVAPEVREALAARGVLGTSVLWFEQEQMPAVPGAADVPGVDGTGVGKAGKSPTGDGEAGAAAAAAGAAARHRVVRPRPLPPERWRAGCLATVTTHDLPPTAARLSGSHVALRHELGLIDGPLSGARATEAIVVGEWLNLLGRLQLLPEGRHDETGVIAGLYRLLARTPAKLVGVWLQDAVGDRRPQNLPGTVTEYPNWRLPIADPDGRTLFFEDLATSPRVHALLTELRRDIG